MDPKYIREVDNRVADALSRLCKEVSTYSFKYDRKLPRLMTISTRRALRAKQVETEDPLVAKLAETGAEDPEYIDMIRSVQEEDFNIQKENELKKIKDHKSCLSTITLESGHKLIIRNDCEILVLKQARQRMCQTLHFTHHSEEMMMKQAKDKIFWPEMRAELREVYETCQECKTNRPSKSHLNSLCLIWVHQVLQDKEPK